MPNSVKIYLPKQIRGKIKGKEVVIKEINNEILIREACLMDNKILTISNCNTFTYTAMNAKNLIGSYFYEIDGDYIVLYK